MSDKNITSSSPSTSSQPAAHDRSENNTTTAPAELTTIEKMQSLRWAIASNAANTIFVQFTFFGTVFVLFLDDLGFSKTDIGFILSFTPFAGLIALFIAPKVAQFGYKRTFVTFWTLRKFVTALLLLTPLIVGRSPQLAFIFVATVTGFFALLRAVAETGRFPWTQEIVPSSQQGKFAATNNIFATLLGILAVTVAGYVIEISDGLNGYMLLLAIGVGFGFLSAWLMGQVAGGAPLLPDAAEKKQQRDLGMAINDRNFRRYLIGAGLIVIATIPVNSFMPLYMQEEIGLASSQVVWLQTGTLLGAMLTSYLWGWASDRYGSQPIMLTGVGLKIIFVTSLLLLPLLPSNILIGALLIAALGGIAEMGWAIGSVRLLFVGIVPPEKKSDYMALYFAVIGVIGGLSQMFSGRILDYSQALMPASGGASSDGGGLPAILTPFLPLFIIGILCPVVARFVLGRIEIKENLTVSQFLGIFFRGNPFLAMSSLIRYNFARSEDAAVLNTERLGQARSVLTIDELLEALEDPRFNVRFEAIIATSRMAPDPRLRESLLRILTGSTPALSVIAAWALGRMNDVDALPGLRLGLEAEYHSIQAHSARALGTLTDQESLPILRERFLEKVDGQWADPGLRMAYASALGKMRDEASVDEMLSFLNETQDVAIRLELVLALARMVGDESHFIQQQRLIRSDTGTAISRAVTALEKPLVRALAQSKVELSFDDELFLTCAEKFARNEIAAGAQLLGQIARNASQLEMPPASKRILDACIEEIEQLDIGSDVGDERHEYLILTLHTIWVVAHG